MNHHDGPTPETKPRLDARPPVIIPPSTGEVTPSETGLDATATLHRQHLLTALRQLDDLQHRDRPDPDAALRELLQTCLVSIPGAQYAAITVVNTHGPVSTLGATHRHAELLDSAHRDAADGPAVHAAWTQHAVHVADLVSDSRWPTYRDLARERTSIRSLLCFGLSRTTHHAAALTFSADAPTAFAPHCYDTGLIYAALTTVAYHALRRHAQFHNALNSRDVIGQAKGMLMQRHDLDAPAAFAMLRQLSQTTNTKLVDLAERLTTHQRLDDDQPAATNPSHAAPHAPTSTPRAGTTRRDDPPAGQPGEGTR